MQTLRMDQRLIPTLEMLSHEGVMMLEAKRAAFNLIAPASTVRSLPVGPRAVFDRQVSI